MKPEAYESFLLRHARWIVWTGVLSFIPAVVFALQALGTGANKADEWLPATMPEMTELRWFYQVFEGDEILVVSWEGCTLDDAKLDALAEAVVQPLPGLDGRQAVWFNWARTGRSVLQDLTSEPLALSRAEALRRMAGWIVGPDGRTSGAVLKVSLEGKDDRHSAVAAMEQIALDRCGLTRGQLHVGGSTIDTVAIDNESKGSLYLLLFLSGIVAFVASVVFLRDIRLVCLILATAALCEAWSLAAVRLAGAHLDLVLAMMPVLVGILAVSGCIHQLNYYVEERIHGGVEGAAIRALRHSRKPAAFSCLTSSLGLLSLLVSDVAPVRKFGFFSALGIGISLVVLLLFLPAALEVWRAPIRLSLELTADDRAVRSRQYRHSWVRMFARTSIRYYVWILGACVVAAPPLLYGVANIRTSIKLQDMFSPKSTVIQDYRWLEAHIGPLVPVEIILRFDRASQSTMGMRLNLTEEVRTTVEALDRVGGTISAGTFAPIIPVGGGARQTALRRIMLRKLEDAKPRLIALRYLAETEQEEIWRISARIETFNDLDYGIFLDRLRNAVDPLIAAANRRPGERVTAVVTGSIPMVYVVQRQLLEDLAASFGAAFASIALVLSFGLRSVRAGLITMIPNALPVLIVFGVMGLCGVVVDLGSMMTISTALGISVDNELHFSYWFRTSLNRGCGRRRALLTAYRHCGRSMAQTAVICGLGMVVFFFSPFTPVSRFGTLMATLIAIAMIGDQVLLPALLVSPLGSFFRNGAHRVIHPPTTGSR